MNHVISGLCTTDAKFPLQLWDKLTEQALITLNIVCTSRINPAKSAYHQGHRHWYDWNKYPMAPPGTRAVLLVDPTTRELWGTCGIDAWYIGPCFDHYRNCIFVCAQDNGMPNHHIVRSVPPTLQPPRVYTATICSRGVYGVSGINRKIGQARQKNRYSNKWRRHSKK